VELLPFLSSQSHKRDEHLFHADAAVLEGIFVILDVVVVVVGIGKKVVLHGEDVGRADVGTRQTCPKRFLYLEDLLLIVREVLSQFVSQIRVRVAISDDFDRIVASDATVVGGQHNGTIQTRQAAEEVAHSRMA